MGPLNSCPSLGEIGSTPTTGDSSVRASSSSAVNRGQDVRVERRLPANTGDELLRPNHVRNQERRVMAALLWRLALRTPDRVGSGHPDNGSRFVSPRPG